MRKSYVFSYFADAPNDAPGLRLATSDDGLCFKPVRGGSVLLTPEVGEGKLMRDPFLIRGARPDEPWHLLWTTAWDGITLGHATSPDLTHWSPQTAIPVMANIPGARNVWAPEMLWDRARQRYVIFWSSTVQGQFEATQNTSENGYNHRLWYTTTRDFRSFSPTQLLWNPGFSTIDATFLEDHEFGLHIIIKDETLVPERKHLLIAKAASPTGPFTDLSSPVSPHWVEGPTTSRVGEWRYIYYDRYRDGKYGAIRSKDLRTWEDATPLVTFPVGARHGAISTNLCDTIDALLCAGRA